MHGRLMTREQALAQLGGRRALANGLRGGSLRRLLPSIIFQGQFPPDLDVLARAALLFSAPDAALSHQTAARLYGFERDSGEWETPPIHVVAPRESRQEHPAIRTHRSRNPDASNFRGYPV